jgi:hypothetical protein
MPIIKSEAKSVFPNPTVAVEAMNKFDGPANGIRLNPKDTKKTIINSISGSILGSLSSS